MSVPEGKRSRGRLTIETEGEKLLQYILDVTIKYYLPIPIINDEKIMRDKMIEYANAKWFAERMRADMLSCLASIQTANKVKFTNDATFYERRAYQAQAERSAENVLTAATLMYRRKLIKSKRVKYIGQQIARLKYLIQNWRKSDKAGYVSSSK